MSTAGVFTLIVNDGKSDRMIHATKLLYHRIQQIMAMRTKQGRDDITPSLIDLERTHIIYVNAHFKPFAAIGFEYLKVKPNSGSVALGASVTFSIPQFGDFFYDMVCRVELDKAVAKTGTLPAQGASTNQTTTMFPLNSSSTANGVTTSYSYNIVDYDRNVLVTGTTSGVTPTKTYRNFVRYCEYPGNRLFTQVKFDVNGNPLDEYDQYVPTMLEKFGVMPSKRSGYNTLVGQQNVLQGVGMLHSNKVYDADSNQPAHNQYAVYGATAYTETATYNTPAGITPFDNAQSLKTYAPFVTNDVTNNLTSTTFPLSNVASLALATGTTDLPNTTVNNFGNATNGVNKFNLDMAQNVCGYVNGFQTPKPVQPPLEVWNKLKFWFCDDVRLSIPSVSIPYGQRFITIALNEAENILYESPSIFLESIYATTTPGIAENRSTMVLNSTGGTVTISIDGSYDTITATPTTSTASWIVGKVYTITDILCSGGTSVTLSNGSESASFAVDTSTTTSNNMTVYTATAHIYSDNVSIGYDVNGVPGNRSLFVVTKIINTAVTATSIPGISNIITGTSPSTLAGSASLVTSTGITTPGNAAVSNVVAATSTGGAITIDGGTNALTIPVGTRSATNSSTIPANIVIASGLTTASLTNVVSATGVSSATLSAVPTIVTGVTPTLKGFVASFSGATYSTSTGITTQQSSKQIKTYTPIHNYMGITTPKVLAIELYVNNIFVNPEIHDIFIRRIGFALVRVYRQQRSTQKTSSVELLLSALKWPIEYLFVGVQPVFNQKQPTTSGGLVTGGNINVWRDWHRMTRQLEVTDNNSAVAETSYVYSSVGDVNPYKYFNTVATADSISLVSHGIKIYDTFSDAFFNNYLPYHYGNNTIVTPEDSGAFFINFALFPGQYQPSGHVNISRARETYLNFTSSYCSANTNCLVIIVAIAINFLLISDGSACLRYAS